MYENYRDLMHIEITLFEHEKSSSCCIFNIVKFKGISKIFVLVKLFKFNSKTQIRLGNYEVELELSVVLNSSIVIIDLIYQLC